MSKNGFIIREEKILSSDLVNDKPLYVKMSHCWLSESRLVISSVYSQKTKCCGWIKVIAQV